MDEIGKNSAKSYYTVQHLFSEEVAAIAKDLKEIASNVKRIKDYKVEKKISMIDDINERIYLLKGSITKKSEFEKAILEQDKRLEQMDKDILKLDEDKKALETGEEFTSLKKDKGELEFVQSNIVKERNKIVDLFSGLESAFRKYQRISLDKTIDSYAENSMLALMADEDLKIMGLLKGMRKSLDSMDIKDKKREKVLANLDLITEEKLKDLVKEVKRLNSDKKIVEDRIDSNMINEKLKDVAHKKGFYVQKRKTLVDERESMKSSLRKIDLDAQKNNIKEKIRKVIFVDVTIS